MTTKRRETSDGTSRRRDLNRLGGRTPLTLVLTLTVLFGTGGALSAANKASRVDFNRDIRPLLSDKCFKCHGPSEKDREAGLRLDQQESAMSEADSGEIPIVPHKPDTSELLQRLLMDDPDMRMPPATSNKSVSKEEIATIRKWIEQGAPWAGHWAFTPPVQARLPDVKDEAWPRNAIDAFVLARLEREGLEPAPEADKVTLLRRVTLDLTGLPPTREEVKAFLEDESPQAYERVADRLLASERYGEHMARFWLDAARYGDTHGLHLDNYREMWLYRDWVIGAFNRNLSFDQFTIHQLAGDLLPDSTDEQLIATGLLRSHVTTNEGGSIKEEVYVRNVDDRVVTTGTMFLGLTFECTRCHNHKYDPITMKDFYSMFAYFNNMDGPAMDGNRKDPPPVLRVMTAEQKQTLADLKDQKSDLSKDAAAQLAAIEYAEPKDENTGKQVRESETVWIDDDLPKGANAQGDWKWVSDPDPVLSGKKASTRTAKGLSQHFFDRAQPLVVDQDQTFFASVYLDPENPPLEIMLQWNDGSWEHRAYWGENKIDWGKDKSASRKRLGDLPETGKWVRLEIPVEAVGLKTGSKINGWAFTQFDGTVYWDRAGVVGRKVSYLSQLAWEKDQQSAGAKTLPKPIQTIMKKTLEKRTDSETRKLLEHFIQNVYAPTRQRFTDLKSKQDAIDRQIADLNKQAPTTLVFREKAEPRKAYVLERGEYDRQRDEVQRAVPEMLPALPDGAPNNRLGLAQWLVDPANPLTARVTVNRLWQQVFGVGIVKTAEDFGSQGEPPSHPQLLDWLAVQFVNDGWDVKKTMKRFVMSTTYRQASQVGAVKYGRDPENRLLARGARYRLDAETLRDQALSVSGLLDGRIGGPSVKPPQPDGIWFAVGYSGSNTVRFKADVDPEKVHRRTLYTFIKRTAPPPELSTLDAPSRESCTVRRERTNTPLQALLLMNDVQYFECAGGLARRATGNVEGTPPRIAATMYELATCNPPDAEMSEVLLSAYRDFLSVYRKNEDAARKTLEAAGFDMEKEQDAAQLAAWTMVGNLVLNLDQVLCK